MGSAGLETRDTADFQLDLEVCATGRGRLSRRLGSKCNLLRNHDLRSNAGFTPWRRRQTAAQSGDGTNHRVVATKVIDRITGHEHGQMLNYLRITKLRVGLVLNFKHASLEFERLVLYVINFIRVNLFPSVVSSLWLRLRCVKRLVASRCFKSLFCSPAITPSSTGSPFCYASLARQ